MEEKKEQERRKSLDQRQFKQIYEEEVSQSVERERERISFFQRH